MRIKLLLVFLHISFALARAQIGKCPSFEWAHSLNTSVSYSREQIAVDDSGAVYTAGIFSGILNIGNDTFYAPANGGLYIAKRTIDSNWQALSLKSGSGQVLVSDIKVSSQGHIIIAGYFSQSIHIGSIGLTSAGGTDAFIAKVSLSGSIAWIKQIGNSYAQDEIVEIDLDQQGNTYILGRFFGSMGLGSINISSGPQNLYVAKLDRNGNWKWAKTPSPTSAINPSAITTSKTGECFISGSYSQTITFGSFQLSSLFNNSFVAKLDSMGNWESAVSPVSSSSGNNPFSHVRFSDLSTDSGGYVYLTGDFKGSGYFGSNYKTSGNQNVPFVAKIHPIGFFQWVSTPAITNNTSSTAYSTLISSDKNGHIFIAGKDNGSTIFSGLANLNASGYIFTANIDPSGNWKWESRFGNTISNSNLCDIASLNGEIYFTGNYYGSISFDTITFTSSSYNTYVSKLSPRIMQVGVMANQSLICGDSIVISANATAYESFTWTPNTNIINTGNLSPTAFPSATTKYILTATDACGQALSDDLTLSVIPFDINPSTSHDSIKCGNSVQLDANPNFSGAGIIYEWSPVRGLSNSTISNPIASPDSNTTYKVKAITPNGCIDSGEVSIVVTPLGAHATASLSSLICGSSVSSQLNVSSTAGVPNKVYSWTPSYGLSDPSIETPLAQPDSTTTYTITVSTLNGCIATDQVTINVLSNDLTAQSTLQTIQCGTSTQLNAVLATPVSGTTYSWNPSNGLSNPNISNPIASPASTTTYTVTATTPNGCISADQVSVNVSSNNVKAQTNNHTINCGSPAQLDAHLPTPVNGTTYSWSPSTGLSDPYIANPIASPAATTTYKVTATTPNGCTSSDQVTINVSPNNVIAQPKNETINCGNSTPLNANLKFPVTNSSYSWNPSNGLDNPNIPNPVASPGSTTTYKVTATTPNGCSSSDEVTITVNNPNPPKININSHTGEFKLCTNGLTLSAAGFNKYEWSTGSTASSIIVTQPGWYKLTAYEASGCYGTDSVEVSRLVSINAPEGTVFCPDRPSQKLRLEATAGMDSYMWSTGEETQNIEVDNPGNYSVTASKAGCTASSNITTSMSNGTASADFGYWTNGLAVHFNVISPSVNFLTWDFGDGSTGSEKNPIHTYAQQGNYNVTVSLTDVCGKNAEKTKTINVSGQPNSVPETGKKELIRVYPNPAGDRLWIELPQHAEYPIIEIYNIQGQLISQSKAETGSKAELNIKSLPPGMYMLRIKYNGLTHIERVVKI